MRMLLCLGWPALYETCKECELKVRKTDQSLLPDDNLLLKKDWSVDLQESIRVLGILTLDHFSQCLKVYEYINMCRYINIYTYIYVYI